MDEKTTRIIFAMFSIGVVASMQVIAWYFGFNGAVFAFTSLVIGLIIGKVLDIAIKK
jgi:hypothetical protein